MFPSVPLTAPVAPAAVHAKPLWRGWLHLLWFEASLVVGTVLITHAGARERGPLTIYAVSVSALFGASALYHRGSWRPRAHRLLQRIDHAMIFVLIAGTATPVFALTVDGSARLVLLGVMWSLAGIALLTHLVRMQAPELVVGSTYVGLGCFGAAALPAVWAASGVAASLLIAGGGAFYIAGALLYHARWPDPVPTVFGFHEVFHAFVCVGATLHYVTIACLIV